MVVKHEVRLARASEVPQLVALMTEFYREAEYGVDAQRAARAFGQLLADDALGRVWLAVVDGKPVGYAVMTLGFSLEYGGRDAFVDDLFVRSAHRSAGVGTALLAELRRTCEELEVRALHLEVERRNASAQALYAAQGFRDNDRQLLTLSLANPLHAA